MRKVDITVVRFGDWPAHDQAAWTAALHDAGPFDDSGALSHYPAVRLNVMTMAYGRWLGFVEDAIGRMPRSGLEHIADRALVDGFLTSMRVRLAPCTIRAYISDLLTVCRAIAPEQRFELLQTAARHVWRTAKPLSPKLDRMVPAGELYKLGFALMAEAPYLQTALKQANHYRDGLMIAMLIACPVRLGNFISIDIGRHLVDDGDNYRLRFPSNEMKNRRPIDLRLPAELSGPIRNWIALYRAECLSRRGRWHTNNVGDALWVSAGGGRYRHGSQARVRIERQAVMRFGKRINPHLFRDIAATSVATEMPQDVGIIQTVLGHSHVRTAERYYNQARSIEASRAHQRVLDSFRTPGEPAMLEVTA